jgi:serine protease AprX
MSRFGILAAAVAATLLSWPHASLQGQRHPTRSGDLAWVRGDRIRVIVQGDERELSWIGRRHPDGLRRQLTGASALEVTRAEFDALIRDSSITHISKDLPVVADVAFTNRVTGAESVWQGTSRPAGVENTSSYQGGGISVAVIDSGIAPHGAIANRVVARVNFVSNEPGVTGDPFGHGTHVAGMIGGVNTRHTSDYGGGSAPAVKFVDIRVLGRTGVGYTSDVLAGIDWAIANRVRYGIRVINLSLGHPVAESAKTDPLCIAVERAVRAGIVVVASAGNYGLTSAGAKVIGGIASPGNSPAAITVGALDTKDTLSTTDDIVAPYSSRGPSAIDLTVKPDVVAPATRVVSLESAGSYLATTYPQWHVAGSFTNGYLRLTGTSMAAAVVSGGVALLLDAQPSMSPAQVKVALQSGARFIHSAGLIGGGTGSVDFAQSLKIANEGLLDSLLSSVTNLLGLSSGASFVDGGTLIDRIYDRTGLRLLSLLDLDELLGGADPSESGVLTLIGLSNPLGKTPANYLVWGSVADYSSSYYLVWGSSIQDENSEYLVWGSASDEDYLVWGSHSSVMDNGPR